MKKLLLLLLLPFAMIAQDTLPSTTASRLFLRHTLPDTKIDKFLGQRDILITGDGKSYYWKGTGYVELNVFKGEKGIRAKWDRQGIQ